MGMSILHSIITVVGNQPNANLVGSKVHLSSRQSKSLRVHPRIVQATCHAPSDPTSIHRLSLVIWATGSPPRLQLDAIRAPRYASYGRGSVTSHKLIEPFGAGDPTSLQYANNRAIKVGARLAVVDEEHRGLPLVRRRERRSVLVACQGERGNR